MSKENKKKKVVVTGGAGFIGSHIVDLLIDKGYKVVVIDSLAHGKKENVNSKAKFYKQDIRDDKIEEIIKEEGPEAVIHEAAQVNVRESLENPLSDADNNILGSVNLLKASWKAKVKKFIFASSGGAVYGDPDKIPCLENSKIDPLSPYGISKRSFELYIKAFARLKGFNYTILRYSNVYGPRQDPRGEAGVVSIFIGQLLNEKTPHINGDGKQTRDFVYVKDVAGANLAALEEDRDKNIFNIGTGKKTSINKLYRQIKKAVDSSIEAEHRKAIPGEVRHTYLNIKRAKKELSWKPKTDLKKGIEETVKWQKKNDFKV